MKEKAPSTGEKRWIVLAMIGAGIFSLYVLFVAEDAPARIAFVAPLLLFGVIWFFIALLRKTGTKREEFWKDVTTEESFKSAKEEREAKKNLLIMIILIAIGTLMVFFL